MGANPARHSLTKSRLARSMRSIPGRAGLFLTETAKRATVVLPAVAYTEKDGTFTNTERTCRWCASAMLPLPGARADWEILSDVARALGLAGAISRPRRSSARSARRRRSMRAPPGARSASRRCAGRDAGRESAEGRATSGSPVPDLGDAWKRAGAGREARRRAGDVARTRGVDRMSDLPGCRRGGWSKRIIVIVTLLTAFAYMTLIERRVIARFQRRVGPNRAGPFGLLQPLADAHEDGLQRADHCRRSASALVFLMAPRSRVFVALVAFAVIPLGGPTTWGTSPLARAWAPLHRRCQRRHALHPRDLVAGGLWHRAGGLVVGQSLLAARRAALGGADGLI